MLRGLPLPGPLGHAVRRIARRRADPQTPIWQAELTRLHVLLIVEGTLAITAIGFGVNDWFAGYPLVALGEVSIGVILLVATPCLRLHYPLGMVDILDLSAVAALLLIVTYALLPFDATILFTIALFPPLATLLRRRKGWYWVVGFLPMHFGVSWLSLTRHQIAQQNWMHIPNLPPAFRFLPANPVGYLLITDYIMYLLVALVVYASTTMLEGYEAAWHEAAAKDPLTGVYNRLAFHNLYPQHYAQAHQTGETLAAILLDIDDFKRINDCFGHNAGDTVLKEVSGLLRKATRRSDVVIRWGGEEFLILLPNTCLEEALSLAERLRETLALYPFPFTHTVTASFGVAELCPEDSLEHFIHRCDQALYFAKEQGKNRVAFWEQDPICQQPHLRIWQGTI